MRNIDSESCWKGESRALKQFKAAFEIDCKGNKALFLSVYRWTESAFEAAKAKA